MRARFYSDFGPREGRLRPGDVPEALIVFDAPEPEDDPEGSAVGLAWAAGQVDDARGQVAAFRLAVGDDELPGLWVLDGRRFEPAFEMHIPTFSTSLSPAIGRASSQFASHARA
jgi:hypothetical protein